MDLRKLNFRHVIWKGTKLATCMGVYYIGGLNLIFKGENLRKKSKIREDIEFELLERNTYLSDECREKALGQMLRFYHFDEDYIKKTLSKIDKNLEGKIDFKKYSI